MAGADLKPTHRAAESDAEPKRDKTQREPLERRAQDSTEASHFVRMPPLAVSHA